MDQWYQLQNEQEQQMWNEEQQRKSRTLLARLRRGESISLAEYRAAAENRRGPHQ